MGGRGEKAEEGASERVYIKLKECFDATQTDIPEYEAALRKVFVVGLDKMLSVTVIVIMIAAELRSMLSLWKEP